MPERIPRINKSCVPCHARKVKCDAAVVGLPCSSCTGRQSTEDCVLLARKGRTRKRGHVLPNSSHITDNPTIILENQVNDKSGQPPDADIQDWQSPPRAEPDLLYLNILSDAVKGTPGSSRQHTTANTPHDTRPDDNLTPRNRLYAKLPRLNDLDNEYLVKKGVFDLPAPHLLDAFIKAYFDHVYPFAPVISRVDFVRGYQSGDCSWFLLRAMLATSCLHVSADVLSACNFASRSDAQESFFSKAKILHDFAVEEDPLMLLQGFIILCTVILDHTTHWDFSYWFYNAVRLATELDIRYNCVREDKPRTLLKLYRRIWWALYSLDIFYVFVNSRRSRLLPDTPAIKLRSEDDWEVEVIAGASSSLLSALTAQQRAMPTLYCELSRIFAKSLDIVTNEPQHDPRQLMSPLYTWRKSLASKMHVAETDRNDVYYINLRALSYRFECILYRLILRRWRQSEHTDWSEWAAQRLQSAILELDTIAMRVLSSGTLHDFPAPFITTMTALLALHIESALDPAQTELVHSMARISISQIMLVLTQGKDIPALKRAIPVFEEILSKNNLFLTAPNNLSHAVPDAQPRDNSMSQAHSPPQPQANVFPAEPDQFDNNMSFDVDFLGFDFLDEWQLGQMEFAGR